MLVAADVALPALDLQSALLSETHTENGAAERSIVIVLLFESVPNCEPVIDNICAPVDMKVSGATLNDRLTLADESEDVYEVEANVKERV